MLSLFFSLLFSPPAHARPLLHLFSLLPLPPQLSPDGERITPDIFVTVARDHKLEPGSDAPPPALLAAAERLSTQNCLAAQAQAGVAGAAEAAAALSASEKGGKSLGGGGLGGGGGGSSDRPVVPPLPLRGGLVAGAGGAPFEGLPPTTTNPFTAAPASGAGRPMGSETARMLSAADATATSLSAATEEDGAVNSAALLAAELQGGLLEGLFEKARSVLGEGSEAYLKLATEKEAFEEVYTGPHMGEEPAAAWTAYRALLGSTHASLVRHSSGERVSAPSGTRLLRPSALLPRPASQTRGAPCPVSRHTTLPVLFSLPPCPWPPRRSRGGRASGPLRTVGQGGSGGPRGANPGKAPGVRRPATRTAGGTGTTAAPPEARGRRPRARV